MPKATYGQYQARRFCRSDNYNWEFDKKTGFFMRWGEEENDDPVWSPVGPEILDIEVSTICSQGCKFCYKSNTRQGKSMSLDEFKRILSCMSPNLTQIAFGIGDIDAVDIFGMMEYARAKGVIPNITINGRATDEQLEHLARVCGAVAVSNYGPELCYPAVHKLSEYINKPGYTIQQVNIHQLLSDETLTQCENVADDWVNGKIPGLNAIVFLMLKPKGRGVKLNPVSKQDYQMFVGYLLANEVPFGFDSCSAPSFLKTTENHSKSAEFQQLAEPCESGLFSSYINVDGKAFACSFSEGVEEWQEGLDVVELSSKPGGFVQNVWNAPKMVAWRKRLLGTVSNCNCKFKQGCRRCPLYDITLCEKT